MAIVPNPAKERVYTLKEDRKNPSEKQTLFKYVPMTYGKFESVIPDKVESNITARDGLRVALHACQHCLVGWTNLKDEDGTDVPFSADAIRDLPETWVTEIGNMLIGANKVKVVELEN